MKLLRLDKVLLIWAVLSGLCYLSDTLLTGVTRSLKAYTDNVVKPILNVSHDQLEKTQTKQPVTLKDYLYQLPFSSEDNLQQDIQPRNLSNSNIVVMTRICDNDKKTSQGEEWIIVTPTKCDNMPHNPFPVPQIENKLQSTINHLRNENNYQEVLFTFKDLVNIGLNPKVNEQITEKQYSDRFNTTYIMSIPKSTKFFELKVTNLTREQHNELKNFVKTHLQKNKNSNLYNKTELNNTYFEKKDKKRQVSSLESTKSSQNSPSVNISSGRFWRNVPNEINLPLHQLFINNNYEAFINKIKHNLSSNFVDLNKKTTTRPSTMKNNGFHAEIATDYIQKDKSKEPIGSQYLSNEERKYLERIYKTNLNNQSDNKLLTHLNDSVIASILKKMFEEQDKIRQNEIPINKSVLFDVEDTSKDSFSNKNFGTSDSIFGSELNKYKDMLSKPQLNIGSSATNDKTQANSRLQESNKLKILNNSTNYKNVKNDISENLNKILNEGDQRLMNSNTSDIGDSTNSELGNLTTNSETQQRNNIDMSFFTEFFHNNESFLLEEEDGNTKLMKINRQGNILDELKRLMLDYFVSLKLNTKDFKNYSSVVQDIINSTNIVELMQRSSQFVKQNLKLKIQKEMKEPSTFVEKIIDIQVDKCKMRFNGIVNSMNLSNRRNSIKKNNHWRFMNLTKCITSKIRECVIGFNMWLAKGRFYLRPQFKLQRAYENYEIERNLFCLRKYNATFLGSNLHGVRMWPGTKISKKSGVRAGQKLGLKNSRNIGKGKRTRKGHMIRKQKGPMTNNNTYKNSNLQGFREKFK